MDIGKGKDKIVKVVDTSQLGSTIMETMLKEVRDFCNPVKRNNWSDSTRQQVCSKCANLHVYCQFSIFCVQYVPMCTTAYCVCVLLLDSSSHW